MKFGTFGPSKLVSSATSTPTTLTKPSVLKVKEGKIKVFDQVIDLRSMTLILPSFTLLLSFDLEIDFAVKTVVES